MEALNGATIFWLIALGMVVGATVKVIMWKSAVDLLPNVIAGIAGSLVIGGVIAALALPGGLLLACMGTVAVIFVLNVFNMQTESPEAVH